MRNYLFLTLLCFHSSFHAQITIDATDFANADDTVRMSQTMETSIDFSSTGPNYFWDFSGLVAQSQILYEYFDMSSASIMVNFVFGPFAPSKYQASYFMPNDDIPLDQLSQFLPIPLEDLYQFTRKTNDSITSIGYGLNVDGNEVPVKSDTIETRYKFPMTYGQTYQSNGYTNLDMNPFYNAIWRQHRHRESVVDGWGTVVTPYGLFQSLRIVHTIDESDSLQMEIFGTPMWIPLPIPTSKIYEWWADGQKEPVLRITTSDLFGSETVTNIEYRDNYLGLDAGISEEVLGLQFFPNPVAEKISVAGVTNFTYQIFDALGKLVATGKSSGTIELGELKAGNYCLVIQSALGSYVHPLIKE